MRRRIELNHYMYTPLLLPFITLLWIFMNTVQNGRSCWFFFVVLYWIPTWLKHIILRSITYDICSITSPFLPKESVFESISMTTVMTSPCVKPSRANDCSPPWYRFPLYPRYSHMSYVVRCVQSLTGHFDTPTHVPSFPLVSLTMSTYNVMGKNKKIWS